MKKLINLFFATLLILSTSAFAYAKTNAGRFAAAKTALETYVETVTRGQSQYAAELFAEQFSLRTHRVTGAVTHHKQEVLAFLKGQQNITQDCVTRYSIIDESQSCTIAKVEMKYQGFTKVDFVTLNKEGGSWKVSQVVSTYH